MKHLLSSLSMCALTLTLVGCVDLEPLAGGYGSSGYGSSGYGNPGYGRPAYRPSYSSPAPYYRDSGYDHHDHRSDDRSYYGGPAAWFKAGEGLGKRDRKEHQSPNYRRHKSQYDGRTEHEFAEGYNAGYRRG